MFCFTKTAAAPAHASVWRRSGFELLPAHRIEERMTVRQAISFDFVERPALECVVVLGNAVDTLENQPHNSMDLWLSALTPCDVGDNTDIRLLPKRLLEPIPVFWLEFLVVSKEANVKHRPLR